MLNRFMLVVILLPIAVVLIALAVANRALVPFTLDPFNPGNPALTLRIPLFVQLFAALGIGLVLGGMGTWFKQSRYRRLARERGIEAQAARDALRTNAKSQPQPGGAALVKSGR